MCYSAQIKADYHKLVREFGAVVSMDEFAALYAHDPGKKRPKTPKAMDDAFAAGKTPAERSVWSAIQDWNSGDATAFEQELFTQKTRLVNAERALQTKVTQKAENDVRVATNKIARAQGKLADLRRTEHVARDSRIFPGVYGTVIVSEGGKRVVKPMRYQCRLAGKPASYDQRYPGTYNARRDSLEGFWRPAFGYTHALMVVDTFYENVEGPDGGNQVVQFTPRTGDPMLVACLWSHRVDPAGREPDLLSFAAITDDLWSLGVPGRMIGMPGPGAAGSSARVLGRLSSAPPALSTQTPGSECRLRHICQRIGWVDSGGTHEACTTPIPRTIVMLNGFKPLAVAALCLLGLSAFAQNAAAAQWVDSGRTAYFRSSAYISAYDYTCNVGSAPITGFPGSCANDAVTGWTANYDASSGEANGQRMACNHNPHQMGSTCYGVAYAINGYAYAGDLPTACSVGTRAVVYFSLMETVEIEHEELDVNMVDSATEYVCQ